MIDMLIGGIYTFIVIAISGFLGYLIGTKELKVIIDAKIEQMKRTQSSGPVKMKTPMQKALDKDGTAQRIKELMGK